MFRVEMAERLETQERTNRGLMYRVFVKWLIRPMRSVPRRCWRRIWPRGCASRPGRSSGRMKVAQRIRPRRQLAGPPLEAELSVLAEAVEAGAVGEDHLHTITCAMDRLPSCVSPEDRLEVQHSLVREAVKKDAELVKVLGRRIERSSTPTAISMKPTARGAAAWCWGRRAPTGCRGCWDGSTPKPAAMWKRSPRRCARAAICPTAPSPRYLMIAALPALP